jgi:Putative DNA-binding domain
LPRTTTTEIQGLLYEPEGSTLDFKSAQYRLANATDEEKSELLKDVLAFANAWRRSDAYILVGVKEGSNGSPAEVVGVSTHLEDASVQEFVNSKTNRAIDFSYEAVAMADGVSIGVLCIRQSERPVYLRKAYGRLTAGVVYMRRGSATVQASPDDVAAMGRAGAEAATAVIEVTWADPASRRMLAGPLLATVRDLSLLPAGRLPRIRPEPELPRWALPRVEDQFSKPRAGFIHDVQVYVAQSARWVGVVLCARNLSSRLASNVVLRLDVPTSAGLRFRATSDDLEAPTAGLLPHAAPLLDVLTRHAPSVSAKQHGDRWLVDVPFGRLQPKACEMSPVLFVGASRSGDVVLSGSVQCDEAEPQATALTLNITVEHGQVDSREVVRLATSFAREDGLRLDLD